MHVQRSNPHIYGCGALAVLALTYANSGKFIQNENLTTGLYLLTTYLRYLLRLVHCREPRKQRGPVLILF